MRHSDHCLSFRFAQFPSRSNTTCASLVCCSDGGRVHRNPGPFGTGWPSPSYQVEQAVLPKFPGNPLVRLPHLTTPPALHAGYCALWFRCQIQKSDNTWDAYIEATMWLSHSLSTLHAVSHLNSAQDSVPTVANFAGWGLHPLGYKNGFSIYIASPISGLQVQAGLGLHSKPLGAL